VGDGVTAHAQRDANHARSLRPYMESLRGWPEAQEAVRVAQRLHLQQQEAPRRRRWWKDLWDGLRLRLARYRSRHCLPLPPRWHHNATNAASLRRAREPPSFVLLWSTDAASFTLRSRRCLESIFYHHRRATVHVYSNQLPAHFFHDFTRLGFDVRVLRYNVTSLLEGTPAARWLARLGEWERGPYFYSHVTDALRLALLFSVGGVYLDTDVLLTHPIRLADEAAPASPSALDPDAAASALAAVAAPIPPLHDSLGIESYSDPRTGLPTLNGAVMAFGEQSRFLWNCLHEFADDYKMDRWSWNGPELLTRVQERCADSDGARVQVEPRERFYPLHWQEVATYADGQHAESDGAMWHTIERHSYAVHVWNRKTSNLTFAQGSLLHRLHNTWTVLPGREECT
jgi:hypothetical protein